MRNPLNSKESGPVRIFKFFSAGVTLVFMLLLIVPGPLGSSDPTERKAMVNFCATYGAIFVYLTVPGLNRLFKRLYMPLVLLAAGIIPIAIINAKYNALFAAGIPINSLDDTMTVTILLLFPLIITAWQYSFSVVFLFYVVLGFLDPLLIILADESFTPEVYGAFNASLIRIPALSAVGFVITELRDRQRREQDALEEANRKLEEYAGSSERLAAARERSRIARDLHDTLAHTLSGLAVQLEAMDTVIPSESGDSRLKAMIGRARSTVRSGLGETRRALKALRAGTLEDMGLPMALQRLADDAEARGGTAVRTRITSQSHNWSDDLEEAVYRIAQEALENIIRHASASRTELEFTGDKHRLTLKVQDDGRGFQPDSPPSDSRFGLRGMHERAESVGGRLSVQSRSPRGTAVEFQWSMKEQ